MIVEGKGQYVFDEQGRRYLDGSAGIVTISVGHCHPDVVEAARRQNEHRNIRPPSICIRTSPSMPRNSQRKCPAI